MLVCRWCRKFISGRDTYCGHCHRSQENHGRTYAEDVERHDEAVQAACQSQEPEA